MSSYSSSRYRDSRNSRLEREKEEGMSASASPGPEPTDPDSFLNEVSKIAERVGRYRNLAGGLWLHGRRCQELVSAYAKVRQKLRSQLLAVPSSNQLFRDVRPALDNLSFAMREGELFVESCRYGPDQNLLWMQKALAGGLSTEAADTHLHDFLVALCAVSDAIKLVVENRANESPPDPPTRQRVPTLPDKFWGERQEAEAAGGRDRYMLIAGRRLNEARSEDLEHMRSHLAEIAMKSSGDDLKGGVARLMQAKIADEEKHIQELERISTHLELPKGVFARFQDVDSLGNICPHDHPYYNDSGIRVQRVIWRPGGPDVFAMKEYLSSKANGYFLQEAPIHLRLHHPNVVQSICVFKDDTRSGLLMELMDMNLYDLLQSETALRLTEKVSIMLQIAKGMEYIHSKGVIHRDLKPENVLVKNPNHGASTSATEGQRFKRPLQVKIADFNVSNAKWNSKYSTKHVGTTVYRAPEVLNEDESEYTKSADVYSFAMVCFQILSGKPPFHDSSAPYRRLVREGKRPKLSELVNCPPYLKHCIGTWWDHKADKRTKFTDICRDLRYLYVALINVESRRRDLDVPKGLSLAFLYQDQATWKTARKALQASMQSWEASRSSQDWINRGYPCVYTRVNDIPYEMHVMSIVLENAEAMPGCFASFMQSCFGLCLTKSPTLSNNLAFHN